MFALRGLLFALRGQFFALRGLAPQFHHDWAHERRAGGGPQGPGRMGMPRTPLTLAAAAIALCALSTGARAQSCQENFQVEGTPMITSMNFRTFQIFGGVDSRKALTSLRQAMLAEGFSNIDTDRSGGALTAVQESSGSGRPQTLRVTARKSGNGTRVDAVFMIQVGQVASADTVRGAMCRVIGGARN
jgi:hypothetical protein